jgi:hypothetical protein
MVASAARREVHRARQPGLHSGRSPRSGRRSIGIDLEARRLSVRLEDSKSARLAARAAGHPQQPLARRWRLVTSASTGAVLGSRFDERQD